MDGKLDTKLVKMEYRINDKFILMEEKNNQISIKNLKVSIMNFTT